MSGRIIRKVADKNSIRLTTKRGYLLYRFLESSPKHHLVITTGNILESTVTRQTSDPSSNFVRDFEGLIRYANQVYIIKNPSTLNANFNWSSAGLQQRLLSKEESTDWHHQLPLLIESMKNGCFSPAFLAKKQQSEEYFESAGKDFAGYLELQRIIGDIPEVQDSDWDIYLKTGYLDASRFILLIKAAVSCTLVSNALRGIPEQKPLCNVMEFRYNLAYMLLALQRRAIGKQSKFQLSQKEVRNDVVDTLYVTQASYFDGFFCHEKTSKRVYELLRIFLLAPQIKALINEYQPEPELFELGGDGQGALQDR